jgi:hypothetical protein
VLVYDSRFDGVSEENIRSNGMTIGSQSHPEYWPPVHQLMHSGWYRAGAPWDANSIEWGLRFGQSVDAETALRCWITAVDEDGTMPSCGADFSAERAGAIPDETELARSSSAPGMR